MITTEEAYKIACSKALWPVAKKAYDYNDYWCFVYGGERPIVGAWPIAVRKKDGKRTLLVGFPGVEFYGSMEDDNLRVITIKEDNK